MDKMENSSELYVSNDDGSVKIIAISNFGNIEDNLNHYNEVKQDLHEYKWREGDFLLASYPRNGTHLTWETMMMLLYNSAKHIDKSKMYCNIEFCPLSKSDDWFPSPRALNTHYRLDVLPKEFRGKPTVLALRNPKDVAVSYYHYMMTMRHLFDDGTTYVDEMVQMTFSEYVRTSFMTKEQALGNYFDYVEYMWSLRDDPNLLIVFYEDFVSDPVATIQKLNEFMETKREPELIEEIANSIKFGKMKDAKTPSMDKMGEQIGIFQHAKKGAAGDIYRKGKVGDWKNWFSVADNEFFDAVLEKWSVGKEIPFKYEI